MLGLSRLKRRLIGGVWIKNKGESLYRYCSDRKNGWLSYYDPTTGCYSGFGRTNVGIETLDDYGKITSFGNFLGYANDSAQVYPMKLPFTFGGKEFLILTMGAIIFFQEAMLEKCF